MSVDGGVYDIPDEQTFRRKVSNKPCKYKKAVVFFNAVWCPPCRMIKSDFFELAARYKGKGIVFIEVDVDKLRGVVTACNVKCLPTFLCYACGDVVDEIIGPDKVKLSEALSRLHRLSVDRMTGSYDPSIKIQSMRVHSMRRALKKLMHL